MTLEDIQNEFEGLYDSKTFLSLANFIGSNGERDDAGEFQDDYATQTAVALVRLIHGALKDTIKSPALGGSIYIRYSRGIAETVFDQLYVDYETVPDNFVQYYDCGGESFLLFYAGDTINDKRHYMDNEELSFEETVDEMLETWKNVMRKLYNLFGNLSVQVREMPNPDSDET